MSDDFDREYYRGQAQKRLRLAYEYACTDLETGNGPDVYALCAEVAGVELMSMFSGPERNVWHDIRAFGRFMRFYPEYPIGADYVDFADPHKKIAIEVDSGVHNRARDAEKNKRLRAAGYRVIRIEKKYAAKDLEELWGTVEALRDAGKDGIAETLHAELPKNSESIIRQLRREHTPKQRIRREDIGKTIALSEVAQSDEFKAYHKKYFSERPKALDDAIAAIPLFKRKIN
jgi:very-short-patch-repair endonuclease